MILDMTDYTDKFLRELLGTTKTIAMVGVSLNEIRPSYFVARYLNLKGYRIVPVNPGQAGKTLFGQMIYPSLSEIPEEIGPIDMVDIFRRSDQVGPIVDDAIAALSTRGLRSIWMQIGVINEDAKAVAEAAGLDVIMNRCPKIEHQRLFGELRKAGFNTGVISSKL
jgi:predicted CoA-binding protein